MFSLRLLIYVEKSLTEEIDVDLLKLMLKVIHKGVTLEFEQFTTYIRENFAEEIFISMILILYTMCCKMIKGSRSLNLLFIN